MKKCTQTERIKSFDQDDRQKIVFIKHLNIIEHRQKYGTAIQLPAQGKHQNM
jgi:hypothetical protein